MADRTGGLRGAWSEVIALLPTPRCFTCRLTICGLQYSQCSGESIWTSHIKSCRISTLPWLERVPKVPPGKEQTEQTTLPRQLLQSPHPREGMDLNILIQLIHASPSLPIGAGIFFQTPHRTHTHTNALPCFALA